MRPMVVRLPHQKSVSVIVLASVVAMALLLGGALGGCILAGSSAGNGIKHATAASTTVADARRRLMQDDTSLTSLANGAAAPGDGGVPDGGFEAVAADLEALFTDSQAFWPADFGNYGPFFIRLAWHCGGSYRSSDGRGGCDGARIRFDPEMSWPDNGNLDKALKLLEPIKAKYGSSLSWGDLIILSGTIAIRSMGAPILGFCGGRVDDADGSHSLRLGPTPEQEQLSPCEVNGQCEAPLGPTTVGLIYVNPEGPMGNPDPLASADDITSSFGRMGLNDSEIVAFIGGGHAFGKMHGPCAEPPCGDGIGSNAFTAGFEGIWTTQPTNWTNQYFTNLMDFNWNLTTGPSGQYQWEPLTASGDNGPGVIMLTSDVALKESPKYSPYVQAWAADIGPLEEAFAAVWYKATSSDMGPHSRCIGDMVPPAQEFQGILPDPPATAPDYDAAAAQVDDLITTDPSRAVSFIQLAWQCASTYRSTDHMGGCNGARIRFPPESDWPENQGADQTLALLEPVYTANADLSWADLIVLAGSRGLEAVGFGTVPFCPGRVDALPSDYSSHLAPRYYSPLSVQLMDDALVKGLTAKEYVALVGLQAMVNESSTTASSAVFANLTAEASGSAPDVLQALAEVDEFAPAVMEYAASEDSYKQHLVQAWTKMMNADRYDGSCAAAAPPGSGAAEGAATEDSSAPGPAAGAVMTAACAVSTVMILLARLG